MPGHPGIFHGFHGSVITSEPDTETGLSNQLLNLASEPHVSSQANFVLFPFPGYPPWTRILFLHVHKFVQPQICCGARRPCGDEVLLSCLGTPRTLAHKVKKCHRVELQSLDPLTMCMESWQRKLCCVSWKPTGLESRIRVCCASYCLLLARRLGIVKGRTQRVQRKTVDAVTYCVALSQEFLLHKSPELNLHDPEVLPEDRVG